MNLKYFNFFIALFFMGILAWAQPGIMSLTSEWESTGFNNGRRMVRDSNGYFHAVWHSQAIVPSAPKGSGGNIFYAYTTVKSAEPPSMANSQYWSSPINLTQALGWYDNRYPSMAIEYDTYDGSWTTFNTIHVVWQAMTASATLGDRYEIRYASITVANPPAPPPLWASTLNLSQTTTDSLVPAIAINRQGASPTDQNIHVVWQEEDINDNSGTLPLPAEDGWFSDILYTRSTNAGLSWSGPSSGSAWDNISNSTTNSQMPTLSCILDQYTGNAAQTGVNELGYNSIQVHVAFNEDFGSGIHVYYLLSPNNGISWNPRIDVTVATYGSPSSQDAYPNIAADMLDNPHITFMRDSMMSFEPFRTGPLQYQPGVDPSQSFSFPGPHVGMYGTLPNGIVYGYYTGSGSWLMEELTGNDREFPTVALDRWQHVNVNWQEYVGAQIDYEIMRITNLNLTLPAYPLLVQNYQGWNTPVNDSKDNSNDDLFPNLVHKKTAMYYSPAEAATAGYDELWTKIPGHGASEATSGFLPLSVIQDGNMTWLSPTLVPVELSEFEAVTTPEAIKRN